MNTLRLFCLESRTDLCQVLHDVVPAGDVVEEAGQRGEALRLLHRTGQDADDVLGDVLVGGVASLCVAAAIAKLGHALAALGGSGRVVEPFGDVVEERRPHRPSHADGDLARQLDAVAHRLVVVALEELAHDANACGEVGILGPELVQHVGAHQVDELSACQPGAFDDLVRESVAAREVVYPAGVAFPLPQLSFDCFPVAVHGRERCLIGGCPPCPCHFREDVVRLDVDERDDRAPQPREQLRRRKLGEECHLWVLFLDHEDEDEARGDGEG